jgi:uncharacterized membrane protein
MRFIMNHDHLPVPVRRSDGTDRNTLWLAAGAGALLGIAGLAWYQARTRNSVAYRSDDDAPERSSRYRQGRWTITGRTITIDRPKSEIYAFWHDFANLKTIMANVDDIQVEGRVSRWRIAGPGGRDVTLVTEITADEEDRRIAWHSTEESDLAHRGEVQFRDAPAGRGTEVTLDLAYDAPGGTLGRAVAKLFQAEPHLQARRDLKRLKMLLETGEIATNANRRDAA